MSRPRRPVRARTAVLPLALALAACAPTRRPTPPPVLPAAGAVPADWAAFVASPGPLVLDSRVGARWAVPLTGLVDTTDPAAAGLPEGDVPIVLPVHILTHPTAGTWVIDSGIDRGLAAGEAGPVRGLVHHFTDSMEPVASLGEMLGDTVPAGVLLTHAHLDHVLGLPDLDPGVPVITGPGELAARSLQTALIRRTLGQVFDDRTALHSLDPAESLSLGPVGQAWDLLGDGSLFALSTPGHTPGSISVLARTTGGPVLFTGDTCHTRWGWEHGVPPGSYTADGDENRRSLGMLQALAQAVPGLVVRVGHELDGAGTGVAAMAGARSTGAAARP